MDTCLAFIKPLIEPSGILHRSDNANLNLGHLAFGAISLSSIVNELHTVIALIDQRAVLEIDHNWSGSIRIRQNNYCGDDRGKQLTRIRTLWDHDELIHYSHCFYIGIGLDLDYFETNKTTTEHFGILRPQGDDMAALVANGLSLILGAFG
jgi:hypothetical protein